MSSTREETKVLRLSCRRSSAAQLEPLVIAPLDSSEPVRYPTPDGCKQHNILSRSGTLQDVEDEGQDLFQNFLKREMELHSDIGALDDALVRLLSGYRNDLWLRDWIHLQQKAGRVAEMKERERFKDRLRMIDLNLNLNYDQFKECLCEFYWEELLNSDQIVLLFHLCSDITIEALKQDVQCFHKYRLWSIKFIQTSLSCRVYQQGGWTAVLKSYKTTAQPPYPMCVWGALSALLLYILIKMSRLKGS